MAPINQEQGAALLRAGWEFLRTSPWGVCEDPSLLRGGLCWAYAHMIRIGEAQKKKSWVDLGKLSGFHMKVFLNALVHRRNCWSR